MFIVGTYLLVLRLVKYDMPVFHIIIKTSTTKNFFFRWNRYVETFDNFGISVNHYIAGTYLSFTSHAALIHASSSL